MVVGEVAYEVKPTPLTDIQSIFIAKRPVKLDYIADETFDPAGMVLMAGSKYFDSWAVDGYTFEPARPLTVEDKEIKVSYGGYTVSLPITVKNKIDPNALTIYVANVKAAAGDAIEVPIIISKNGINDRGIGAINRLTINFDDTYLEWAGSAAEAIVNGGMLDHTTPQGVNFSNTHATITFDSEFGTKSDGILITLKFNIKEKTPDGEIELLLNVDSISDDSLNLVTIPPSEYNIINGNIIIGAPLYGDVNNDTFINGTDVTLLRRHIAGWLVEINTRNADVNVDGVINGTDVTLLRRFIAGWPITLGPQKAPFIASIANLLPEEEQLTISTGNIIATAGEIVEIPIIITNNGIKDRGIGAINRLTIAFADTYLEWAGTAAQSIINGNILDLTTPQGVNFSSTHATLTFDSEYGSKSDGALVTLRFKIKENTPAINIALILTVDSISDDSLYLMTIPPSEYSIIGGNITVKPPICVNHIPGEKVTIKEATCTEEGAWEIHCTVCGELIDSGTIDALGHIPGERVTIKEATCTEEGAWEIHCTVCGELIDSGPIDALGHMPGEKVTIKEATCTEEGAWEIHCTVCGALIDSGTIGALGHIPGEKITIKEATCTEEGAWEIHCTVCGELIDSGTIDALGHIPGEKVIIKEATCTEEGAWEIHCTVCDELIDSGTIDALGHDFVLINHKDATSTEDGYDYYVCSRCNEALTVVIPATGYGVPTIVNVMNPHFVSINETMKNSKVWILMFNATVIFSDGSSRVVLYSVYINGNNANQDGKYIFTADHDLGGYTLVYDIKGNGSNIKEFKLIK